MPEVRVRAQASYGNITLQRYFYYYVILGVHPTRLLTALQITLLFPFLASISGISLQGSIEVQPRPDLSALGF